MIIARQDIIRLLAIFAAVLGLAACGRGGSGKAAAPVEFPQVAVPGLIGDPQERVDYMVLHFWDAFADPARTGTCDSTLVCGVRKEDVEEKYGLFATLLDQTSPKTAESAMVRLYERAEQCEAADTASNLFETLVEFSAKYLFDPNSPVRSEDRYLPFVERLATSAYVTPGMQQAYAFDAQVCRLNHTGTPAADFRIKDRQGRVRTLYGIQAPYTLLFFSNPGCEACKAIIDQLQASPRVSQLIGGGTLAVVNVYIDEDLDAWMAYSVQYPSTWISGYDPDYAIRTDLLYGVRAIPSLYLLDAKKDVLLKDVPPEKLFAALERL